MNLHVVSDSPFINKFIDNLREIGADSTNKVVVRTNARRLRYISHDVPFAPLYTNDFSSLTGNPDEYSKVFIHQFSPLLYRWVATQKFRELNWMVWGADLYNLPDIESSLYEPLTLRHYVRRTFSLQDFLYRAKIAVMHNRFRRDAYGKVNHLLTWMSSEYDFAVSRIDGLKASHQFFFYENDLPYRTIDELANNKPTHERPVYVLGNSSNPELNHLDAVAWLQSKGICADLLIPVSYGNVRYRNFLKEALSFYTGGRLRYFDEYMPFDQYLQVLADADGLIMNNIRPQGYGNILLMMYMGKSIFLNRNNISIPDLSKADLVWKPIDEIEDASHVNWRANRDTVAELLSHETLLKVYNALFT